MKIPVTLLTLFLLVSYGQCAVDDHQLKNIQETLLSNPKQALITTQKLWNEKTGTEYFELGLLHIRALISNKKLPEAEQIIKGFQTNVNSTQIQKDLMLGVELYVARQSEKPEYFDQLVEKINHKLSALKQKKDTGVERLKLTFNSDLAANYYLKQDFEKAAFHYLKAIESYEPLSPVLKSDILNRLGVVYAMQARLVEAGDYMLQSINVLEANDLPVNAISFQNLGALYYQLKDYEKTIKYSELALAAQAQIDAKTPALYSNIAAAYVELNQQDLAIDKLKKAIEISEQLNVSAANAHNNLGYIYHQMGRYEEALIQLNISAQDIELEENQDIKGVSYKSRGDVYASMKKFDQATELYEQAYQTFKQHDYKMKRAELYPKMIAVLELKGDYLRAYQLMVEYKTLNDELTDVESSKQVSEIMTAFEVKQNQRALLDSELARAKQQIDLDLLNSKNETAKSIRTLMIIMVSALLLLLLYIFRSWHFRGRVNQVLTDKNDHIVKQQNQLLELNTQLQGQAEIDELTGIHNRRYIANWLAKNLVKSKQLARRWCLVIIDIDDFKVINDTYGHQRGDEVLQQFAQCLEWVRSSEDVIARWGGEEFLWLIEVPESQDSSKIGANNCEIFKTALADLSWFRGNEDSVTCSMGFTTFPLFAVDVEDWEVALKLADHALYHAKNSGKNQWFEIKMIDENLKYNDFGDMIGLIEAHRLTLINAKS